MDFTLSTMVSEDFGYIGYGYAQSLECKQHFGNAKHHRGEFLFTALAGTKLEKQIQ